MPQTKIDKNTIAVARRLLKSTSETHRMSLDRVNAAMHNSNPGWGDYALLDNGCVFDSGDATYMLGRVQSILRALGEAA